MKQNFECNYGFSITAFLRNFILNIYKNATASWKKYNITKMQQPLYFNNR